MRHCRFRSRRNIGLPPPHSSRSAAHLKDMRRHRRSIAILTFRAVTGRFGRSLFRPSITSGCLSRDTAPIYLLCVACTAEQSLKAGASNLYRLFNSILDDRSASHSDIVHIPGALGTLPRLNWPAAGRGAGGGRERAFAAKGYPVTGNAKFWVCLSRGSNYEIAWSGPDYNRHPNT